MSNRKPAGPATKSKNRRWLQAACVLSLFCLTLAGQALPQIIENPLTGHKYEYVRIRGFINWDQAREEAASRGGYLATVTDSLENGIVAGLLAHPGEKAFLGATDYLDSCMWTWVTGEPWRYQNWAPGEPSGEEPCENSLRTSYELGGKWEADVGPLDGFIVEWNAQPIDTLLDLRQWPVSEGGNGHWYAYLPSHLSWEQAQSAAGQFEHNGIPGHLATITSEAENTFVFENIANAGGMFNRTKSWLGGHNDSLWTWVTGESFDYTKWGYGHPGDSIYSLAVAMVGPPWFYCLDCPHPSEWVSNPRNLEYPSIVEFDTGSAPLVINYLEWPVSEGGNGHTYAIMMSPKSWPEAKRLASLQEFEGVPGHLATITSPAENQFVVGNFIMVPYPAIWEFTAQWWIGAVKPAGDDWGWITGEPFRYSNWIDSVPTSDNSRLTAAIVAFGEDTSSAQIGTWIQRDPACSGGFLGDCLISLVEFETEPTVDTLINLAQWPVSEGGNGHWYAVIPQGVSWFKADSLASGIEMRGATGHLATVTSPHENQFILEHILPGAWPGDVIPWKTGYWLGGLLHAEGWRWVTGEPFGYDNFVDTMKIGPGYQHAITMIGECWDVNPPLPGQWVSNNANCDYTNMGCPWWAVVEFDTPGDTLIRYVQWPVSEGGNGHWYGLTSQAMSWDEAQDVSAALQVHGEAGHIASVTSEGENQFILNQVIRPGRLTTQAFGTHFWLGGFGWGPWEWTTGEPFVYTNWADGYPLSFDTLQALAMFGSQPTDTCPTCPSLGEWISRPSGCGWTEAECLTAVIEFDTEPVEPRVLRVPQEFPSIQAAINAARHGDRVLVSPGTYHESINFRGKNIVVRSAEGPLHTTITNDRTVNLVTFDHGETHEAKLEGFTLSGGWIAVLCVNSAPTISHNICVGQHVWNWAAICLSGPLDTIFDPTGDPRYGAHLGYSPAVIVNNTIVNSSNGGISTFSVTPPTIWNNIVAFNANYGIHQQSLSEQEPPIIGYNDVFGHGIHTAGPHGDYINIPDPGPGSISADPQFESRPLAANFTLSSMSPCIDAGDPNPRFNDPDGSRNDMGAVPFGPFPGGVIPTDQWIVVYCSGSVNEVPPLPGTMIRAFDPQGVLCGEAVIRWDGSFGLMPIYRDDPYTRRDEGCQPGDLIQFKIYDMPVQPSTPVYWTANGDVFEVCDFGYSHCVNIPLHTGWNLVSWNVAFEGPIRLALDEIIGCVEVVHSYEQGGLTFDPNLDQFNTLTHVDYHHGYWIRMRCDAVLQVCGDHVGPEQSIGLEAGWNLVSYWPEMAFPVEDGFVTILDHLEEAMGFDNGAQVWLPGLGHLNTLTELRPRFGYWTKVDAPLLLTFPPFGGQPPDSIITNTNGIAEILSLVEPSRNWMSVYGSNITIDGRTMPEGAIVTFFVDETVPCGRGVYHDGALRFTPVYGHDGSGEVSKLYPNEGDPLAVFVDGQRVYPDLQWSSNGARVRLSRLTLDVRGLPQEYELAQNYPNPFNPGTMLAFDVPVDGHVKLSIFNVLGQQVRTLTDREYPVGRYELEWNGRDDNGELVASGVYFYRLTAGDAVLTKKMMLLK